MAKQNINVGTAANDKKGDSLRAAFQKVNANFTELYKAVGLADTGQDTALTFVGSTIGTDDSSSIVIDRATTITSNLSVGGDILPQTAHGGDLGSSTLPWRSLYVSNNTIFLGGTALSVNGAGNLLVNGSLITGGGSGSSLVNGNKTVSLDTDGNLTLPTQGKIMPVGDVNSFLTFNYGDDVELKAGDNLYLSGSVATIRTNGNANQWIFGTDGTLTAPGTITASNLIVDAGNISFLGNGSGIQGAMSFNLSTNNFTNNWNFSQDGTLSLPNNGSLTFPDGTTQTTAWTGFSVAADDSTQRLINADEVVKFIGAGGITTASDAEGNITITGSGGGVSSLVNGAQTASLGSDGALTIPGDIKSNGNINIDINLGDSTLRRWQFGEDGNLTLPAGGNISEGGGLTGNAIKLTPAGGANANQALLIYPTGFAEGDHIHLTAGGGSTELYLGDDLHFVKLTSDGFVVIKAYDGVNGAVWGFSPDGTTSIPGDIKSDSNINIEINLSDSTLRRWSFGEDGDTVFPTNISINYSGGNVQFPRIIADSGKAFSVQGQGTSGSAALSWTVNPDAAGQYAAVAVTRAGGGNLATVVLQAQSDSGDAGTAKIWKFDETGSLELPNGSVIKDTDYLAVAFGLGAGFTGQGIQAVAVGGGAGFTTQGNAAVAIGKDAGGISQGINAVAVGADAGYTGQGINAVAIGIQAGYTNQAANSIIINATGATLNQTTANTFTVKPVRQDETADAMYYNSSTGEITYADAFSFSVAADDSTQRLISNNESIKFIGAGGITTASDAEGNITINYVQGDIRSEGNINIDINLADSTLRRWHFGEDGELTVPGPISGLGNAKLDFTTYANVAYLTSTSNDATALYMGSVSAELYAQTNILIRTNTDGTAKVWTFGDDGSLTLPGEITLTNGAVIKDTDGDAVAFGQSAGATSQGTGAVAVGNLAGQTTQGSYSVAIGTTAGLNSQGGEAVAIGVGAGGNSQGGEAVAIGTNAGYDLQGINAVAIGRSAGGNSQGTNAIAIGTFAGQTNQAANSIILNATGGILDQTTANTFTVAPIRNISATSGVLQYNASTKEVSYSNSVTAETFNTDQITVVGNRISTTVTNANLELECNGSGGVVINTLADATTASTVKSVGYLGLPQSGTSTSATLAIGDAGKHIYVTTTGQTITIPAAASVAYPIGTTLTFIAGPSATTVTIAITSDTLRLAGGTSTGSRTLAANGMATAVKVAATTWYINGTGLT